ncbi:ATPase-like protein [Bradyrhizobium sp. STM 3843]|uniref:AAA family ATPase n=1 Tax=Bradyrhizobium sp. STM 3843 TaxID=551947 RepID=UPI0002403D30|nr:AAA family ATPase [Bradyrhizobium sp. STM 3843]CCE09736.1 ATPase-like protein [Bradyrhizobium sp. STM 3843]
MPLSAVHVENYRSVRNLWLPVEQLTIFVGANGVGKTNLYKALALLRGAADGSITRAIAEEGGLESVFWAGRRREGKPVRLVLKAQFDELEYGIEVGLPHSYEIELGLPQPTEAAFGLEPLIKTERVVVRQGRRDVVMMERKGPLVMLRNDNGARETHKSAVLASETALAAFRDAARYPELEAIRREMLEWRLYHDFRTDAASPIRQPCHAITTPTLSADGRDLAAVLATLSVIREDTTDLDAAVDDAFPGARLHAGAEGSWCQFSLSFPDMPRSFLAHELSDGTLKYLCLLGALMGYRLPPLIALNEPEASLHPSLLAPLARLIARAAGRARIWIVTHSEELTAHLQEETGKRARRVVKSSGATGIEGLKLSGEYAEEEDDDDE